MLISSASTSIDHGYALGSGITDHPMSPRHSTVAYISANRDRNTSIRLYLPVAPPPPPAPATSASGHPGLPVGRRRSWTGPSESEACSRPGLGPSFKLNLGPSCVREQTRSRGPPPAGLRRASSPSSQLEGRRAASASGTPSGRARRGKHGLLSVHPGPGLSQPTISKGRLSTPEQARARG
jgi:hypothetical protein